VRLFVAAVPSERARRSAAGCTERLRLRLAEAKADRGIRWIAPEQLHLTVWFLGEVSDARADAILDALRPPLDVPPFDLQLARFGAFPPSGGPRVLWMGVTRGVAELAAAHDQVGARLQPWGFPVEARAYSAHLTVARVKDPPQGAARAALREALRRTSADAGSCRIGDLTVFRSRTSPKGALYEPLLRVPLR
jgi:RNA 2',3'-cyclic 3'-phosphodiesterase